MLSFLGERLSALSTLALIASHAHAVCRVSNLFLVYSGSCPTPLPASSMPTRKLFSFLNKKGQGTGNSDSDLASAFNQV